MGVDGRFFVRKASLVGRHRDRVELALTLGVAPRRLAGWEPVTVTEYEYDDAGRLVRAVTTREPEFDEEQVDLLFAAQQLRADINPQTGQPMSVATDPMGRAGIKDKPGGWHYEAHVIATDNAAVALIDAQTLRYKDEQAAAHRETDVWVVEKRPDRIHRPNPSSRETA